MKKNDIAALIIIIAIAVVVSYFAANALIGKPQNSPVQVEKMSPIGATFPAPDKRIFSANSIDPTVEINGGGQSADKPFTSN